MTFNQIAAKRKPKHCKTMLKFRYYLLLSLFFLYACHPNKTASPPNKELYQYINPFIGTGGHGHTYPGAVQPFGMVQVSPDTRLEGWDGCSGYHYSDSIIYGFSHTHLSGTGVSDYGDLLLMPISGENNFDNHPQNGYPSTFRHNKEIAEAGYYRVYLDKYDIQAELTATLRCALHRYTFPKNSKEGKVVIDLEHRDQLLGLALTTHGNTEITGFRRSSAWAKNQHLYFVIQFSTPFTEQQTKEILLDSINTVSKAILTFNLEKKPEIIARVGISAVSLDGARKNLEKELPHFDFDKIKKEAQSHWNKAVSKITVAGGSEEQKHIFYTALYHNLIVPNTFSDVDGQYRGMDGKIHRAENFDVYTIFSLWDTFRATHPLYTLIEQKRTLDFIQTFLRHYEEGGRLPVWELAGNETDCMIGYHSVSVIADAYLKGIRGFDEKLALEAMLHSADRNEKGLNSLRQNSVIEMSDNPESVSKNLEYAYDNWCIAMMAKEMGNDTIYQDFIRRAQYYKNNFDAKTGFMRARFNGGWFAPFAPEEVNFNYTEANAWQYSLFVPQDISGLMQLLGGAEKMEAWLDKLFSTSSELKGTEQADITGLIGQYAHGNEPSHHKAYLYNFVGKPHKTQAMVRRILSEMYQNAPDGLSGNEDCGQMSAWYVLSAMGFYSVTPSSDFYVIGSPIFDTVTLNLENGKQFSILAKGVSAKNSYIKSATLNGQAYPFSYLKHSDIMQGGRLELEMSDKPDSDWATKPEHRPVTAIPNEFSIVPLPHFETASNAITDSLQININGLYDDLVCYYWMGLKDQTEKAQRYEKPIVIRETTHLFAYAVNKKGEKSPIVSARYVKADPHRKIFLKTAYAARYAGGGDPALIDGLMGGDDFRSGFWQGYQGADLEFVVDLGERKTINYLALHCLQDAGSWIWFPRSVSFELSDDNINFITVGEADNIIPEDFPESTTQALGVRMRRQAQYIRVRATNMGKCPAWHPGVGGDTWIFADELLIE